MSEMTPTVLQEFLSYCPETGDLTWRPRAPHWFADEIQFKAWNAKYADKPAFFSVADSGYKVGQINHKPYKAHRIIWAIVHGEWPTGLIDHINGDRSDNRIENLRVVSPTGNMRNMRLPSRNKSGVIGVWWNKRIGKWTSQIRTDGGRVHVGDFSEKDDAIAARKAASERYGYHDNHGRSVVLSP